MPITYDEAPDGFLVLLPWIPLREMPALGTISNAIVIGLAADATLAVMHVPDALWLRVTLLISGVVFNGLATALYICSQLGRGPRDGLLPHCTVELGLPAR